MFIDSFDNPCLIIRVYWQFWQFSLKPHSFKDHFDCFDKTAKTRNSVFIDKTAKTRNSVFIIPLFPNGSVNPCFHVFPCLFPCFRCRKQWVFFRFCLKWRKSWKTLKTPKITLFTVFSQFSLKWHFFPLPMGTCLRNDTFWLFCHWSKRTKPCFLRGDSWRVLDENDENDSFSVFFSGFERGQKQGVSVGLHLKL